MKRLIVVLGMVMVGGGLAFADTAPSMRPNTQKAKGGAFAGVAAGASGATQTVSGSAEVISGVSLSCGGSACTVGLYDIASGGSPGNAQVVFEASAPANQGIYVNLKDAPVRTTTGVSLVLSGTGNSAVVFTEQNVP